MSKYSFDINGLQIEASFKEEDVNEVYIPLLRKLTKMCQDLSRRIIVYVAAPPGCGKSTFGYFLQYLSAQHDDLINTQVLGIDGFQYTQEHLRKTDIGNGLTLSDMKGIPETFNVELLESKIKQVKNEDIMWPLYSRKLHDPIEDMIHVTEKIVIIEGNYLLYSKGLWQNLKDYCDFSIFLNNSYDILKERLISRKMLGGANQQEAIEHFYLVDEKNVNTVLENRLKADMEIDLGENNEIIEIRGL